MIFANICAFGLLCVVHAMRRRQCPRPKLVPHTILVDGSQTASQPHDFLHYTYACRYCAHNAYKSLLVRRNP